MTPRLFVRDDAAADIEAAAGWYEDQRPGLGTEYARAIRAQLAAVEREPRLFRVVHRDVRRALVRRFPYGIYFVIESEHVVVFACLHMRRDPTIWRSRL
jgi:plasmid stabilization system protein ParE